MRAPHATRVVEMRERTLDPLAPLSHQSASTRSADPPTIAIDGRLGFGLLRPIASSAIWFGDVGPNADGLEVHHRLITVIPLVADDLLKGLRLFDVGLRLFDLFGRGNRRFDDR